MGRVLVAFASLDGVLQCWASYLASFYSGIRWPLNLNRKIYTRTYTALEMIQDNVLNQSCTDMVLGINLDSLLTEDTL